MENNRRRVPTLRFSPLAWAKLLYLRDYGETEVGGFGIAPADDLLFVEDVQLVNQVCSWAHVAFDDASVADLFDEQVDAGRQPEQFARVWIHTHPGESPRPSGTDENTFQRVFGSSNWACMFIVARAGATFARLRFNVGPGGECEIPVEVDYSRSFNGCDRKAWEAEYLDHVRPEERLPRQSQSLRHLAAAADLEAAFENGLIDDIDEWCDLHNVT